MTDADQLTSTATAVNADNMIGIIVALPEELSTLTRNKLSQGECCRIDNNWIAYSGAGHANAAKAAHLLITKGCKQLISWGCAAGLSHTLKPGDLVLASQIANEHQQFDTDSFWLTQVQQSLPASISIHTGKLFSSVELVSSHQQKQHIHQSSQAIALDMESAAIAETARRADLPCLVIRSIADPASMDLPQAVLQALNGDGQVELPRLLRYLLMHPWEVLSLILLGLHFHAAQKTLKIVARHLRLQETQQAQIAN